MANEAVLQPSGFINQFQERRPLMKNLVMAGGRWVSLFLLVSVLVSLLFHNPPLQPDHLATPQHRRLIGSSRSNRLNYDFYRDECLEADQIVKSAMEMIQRSDKNASAHVLRLQFHDCFIQGCDASILLDDSNGNASRQSEKDIQPNQSLKGFDYIDVIKEELEAACPGIVSCSDTLVLATRYAVVLSGGPFYPVLTGRRDSLSSYPEKATAELPSPFQNISETIRQFSERGFSIRDTVSLLGGHNIGKVHCQFIAPHLLDLATTGGADPTIPSDFVREISQNCIIRTLPASLYSSSSIWARGASSPMVAVDKSNSSSLVGTSINGNASVSLGSAFGSHYYEALLRGRGILFSDQQLMADNTTAALVKFYESNRRRFLVDFGRAMIKMSRLGVLTGSQGQVRVNCSRVLGNFQ